MTDLTQMNDRHLYQQVADSLNELGDRGVRIATGTDSTTYIGPNYFSPYGLDAPGLCLVFFDGRWVVQDQTPRCAECPVPLDRPGMTYCSTRCRNAADRHDQDVEVDA